MFEGLRSGSFYLWSLDNEASWETDCRRMLWNAGDIVEDRPALSRWHPDYAEEFAAYVKSMGSHQ